ncbi:hypothetical protein CDEST_11028 [Colletotrichum destructivum]|uniref:Uncharacterized protein n=1 Tax=Colletotrichum destructivum TaxID=34406 RepID=A0AAX4IS06_9PEZI|nr:hypothetical protein CDEST_11028 [Colletotrichum destructivum]
MKYTAATLLALVAVSNAAHCNAGWGMPSGASCPGSYPNVYCCQEPGSIRGPYYQYRTCSYPGRNGQPVLESCLGDGYVQCCP